jgi:hypothetical protein
MSRYWWTLGQVSDNELMGPMLPVDVAGNLADTMGNMRDYNVYLYHRDGVGLGDCRAVHHLDFPFAAWINELSGLACALAADQRPIRSFR